MRYPIRCLLALLCLITCIPAQASTTAGRVRVAAFLSGLTVALQSTIQYGIVRQGGAEFRPLSASQIKGVMSYISPQGLSVSDVNVNSGEVHRYSVGQVRRQMQQREGIVFRQLWQTRLLYSWPDDPDVRRVRYRAIKNGLTATMFAGQERLTFGLEAGRLQLQRMDNFHADGDGP